MKNNINNKNETSFMRKIIIMFLMIFSLSSIAYANNHTQNELLRYEFEECSGNIALDTSGNDNHALAVSTKWEDNHFKFGSCAIEFDNIEDYVNSLSSDTTPNKLSVSLWTRRENFNQRGTYFVIQDNNVLEHFHLKYNGQTSTTEFHYKGTDDNFYVIDLYNTPLDDKTYYHSVISINEENNLLQYYINSNLVYNETLSVSLKRTNETKQLRIGNDFNLAQNFEGIIDTFRLFEGILNQSQVNTLYNQNTITLTTIDDNNNSNGGTPVSSSIINSSTPEDSTNAMINENIEYELNTQSTCDLYINNKLTETYNNVVSFIYPLSNLEPFESYTHFAYCSYEEGNETMYEIGQKKTFNLDMPTKTIEFFIFDMNNNYLNYDDLYMVTPCFTKQELSKYYNTNKEVYIQKLVNGRASFNLSYTSNYNFCMMKGRINYLDNDFSQIYDLNEIDNQIDLGRLFVGEDTLSYSLKVSDEDIYKINDPKFWGESWKSIFGIVISLIVGGGIVAVGLAISSPQLLVMGTIIIALGLGLNLISEFMGSRL